MIAVRDEIELGRAILDEVGLSIGPDHNLVDEESGAPVQFNGKMRFTVDMAKSATPAEVEAQVRSLEQTAKWSAGMNIVKVIVVPGRIINIVLK